MVSSRYRDYVCEWEQIVLPGLLTTQHHSAVVKHALVSSMRLYELSRPKTSVKSIRSLLRKRVVFVFVLQRYLNHVPSTAVFNAHSLDADLYRNVIIVRMITKSTRYNLLDGLDVLCNVILVRVFFRNPCYMFSSASTPICLKCACEIRPHSCRHRG